MNSSVPDVVGKLREQLAAIEKRASAPVSSGGHPKISGYTRSSDSGGQRDPNTGPDSESAPVLAGDSDADDRIVRDGIAEVDRIAAGGGGGRIHHTATGHHSAGGGSATDNDGTSDDSADDERNEEQLAKAICLRLLADSARPRAGLQQKLLRRGISPEVIEHVLDRFTEVGLIDDQAYAEAFVRTKHQERALSRHALAAELRRKGVDDGFVQSAVEQVDTGAEESRAAALMTKRVPAAMAAGPEVARRRLLGLLDRRGYPPDMSIRVVDDAIRRHLDESVR